MTKLSQYAKLKSRYLESTPLRASFPQIPGSLLRTVSVIDLIKYLKMDQILKAQRMKSKVKFCLVLLL